MFLRARCSHAALLTIVTVTLVVQGCSDNSPHNLPSEPAGDGDHTQVVVAVPDTTRVPGTGPRALSPRLSTASPDMAAAHPELRIAVVGGDTTNEMCRATEFCAIQGQAAEGYVAVLCTAGPGNCDPASYEWSIQDAPPKSTTTFAPDTTVTDQYARVSIQTKDSTPPEMYLVTFVPTPLPGYPPPNPLTVQGVVHVLCSFKYQTCPRIEIVDRGKSDTVVSLPVGNPTTRTTLIGKHMDLLVRATDTTKYTLQQAAWTLFMGSEGDIVKDYEFTSTRGKVHSLRVPDDLNRLTLSYYYAVARNGYPIAVEGYVIANDNPNRVFFPEAGARYDLKGPTAVVMTTATTSVIVGPNGGDTASTWLSFGDAFVLPGIQFQFTAMAPGGDNGYVAGTQLVQKQTTSTPNAAWLDTGGAFWLDACPLYSSVQTGIAGPPGTNHQFIWRSGDSPGTQLLSAFATLRRVDQFQMYFMYRPEGAQSIWVPLGQLDWFWNGTASKTGNPLINHGWTGPTNSSFSANPVGAASTVFPQWDAVYPGQSSCAPLPTQ